MIRETESRKCSKPFWEVVLWVSTTSLISFRYNVERRSIDMTFYLRIVFIDFGNFLWHSAKKKLRQEICQVAIIKENDGDSSLGWCHNFFQFPYNAKWLKNNGKVIVIHVVFAAAVCVTALRSHMWNKRNTIIASLTSFKAVATRCAKRITYIIAPRLRIRWQPETLEVFH